MSKYFSRIFTIIDLHFGAMQPCSYGGGSVPVLDTFNLPRQSIEPQQLPRQKLAGALAAAISPARHGDLCHYFFLDCRGKIIWVGTLPRQNNLGRDFAAAISKKIMAQIAVSRRHIAAASAPANFWRRNC